MSDLFLFGIAVLTGGFAYGILTGKIFRPLTDCEKGLHVPGPFKTFFLDEAERKYPWQIDSPAGKRSVCTRCGKTMAEQSYRFR